MTKEQIKEYANKIVSRWGDTRGRGNAVDLIIAVVERATAEAAREATLKERERCARIAESTYNTEGWNNDFHRGATAAAIAIRAEPQPT